MTKRECAIVMAYTGICMCEGDDFNIFHKYVEEKLGRPIFTHELPRLEGEIKDKSMSDFLDLCKEAENVENQPAKSAQWEFVHYDPDYLVYSGTCTACKKKHESTDNVGRLPFCPHCGAQMTGVKAPVLISADEDGESV